MKGYFKKQYSFFRAFFDENDRAWFAVVIFSFLLLGALAFFDVLKFFQVLSIAENKTPAVKNSEKTEYLNRKNFEKTVELLDSKKANFEKAREEFFISDPNL